MGAERTGGLRVRIPTGPAPSGNRSGVRGQQRHRAAGGPSRRADAPDVGTVSLVVLGNKTAVLPRSVCQSTFRFVLRNSGRKWESRRSRYDCMYRSAVHSLSNVLPSGI